MTAYGRVYRSGLDLKVGKEVILVRVFHFCFWWLGAKVKWEWWANRVFPGAVHTGAERWWVIDDIANEITDIHTTWNWTRRTSLTSFHGCLMTYKIRFFEGMVSIWLKKTRFSNEFFFKKGNSFKNMFKVFLLTCNMDRKYKVPEAILFSLRRHTFFKNDKLGLVNQ